MTAVAAIEIIDSAQGLCARLRGDWTLATLPQPLADFDARLRDLTERRATWDLHALGRLDSVGAVLLWRAWGRCWPVSLQLTPGHRHVLERVAQLPQASPPTRVIERLPVLHFIGRLTLAAGRNVLGFIALIGQLMLDVAHLWRHPHYLPWREFSANLYKSGARALPVTALVGFLIGIVLSYLSSLQLKTFGADVFIVNLLGISIVRELGPVLVAVLVAGRSGSAMTAQIGVMRVTEEIDALAAMGVSQSVRLVLPKVAALAIAMPLLVLWCSAAGIVGGMLSAHLQMDLDYGFFLDTLPRVVPLANLWIGLAKGLVFGLLIGLLACHFGLRVRPNTESLSARTTSSVVSSITAVILVDAVFAILTRHIGMP